jgi:hypothetical protein
MKGDFPMNVLMVRSKVKAAHVTEIEAGIQRLFAALQHQIQAAECGLESYTKKEKFFMPLDSQTGSGTNQRDMVDSESKSVLKKRNLEW